MLNVDGRAEASSTNTRSIDKCILLYSANQNEAVAAPH